MNSNHILKRNGIFTIPSFSVEYCNISFHLLKFLCFRSSTLKFHLGSVYFLLGGEGWPLLFLIASQAFSSSFTEIQMSDFVRAFFIEYT